MNQPLNFKLNHTDNLDHASYGSQENCIHFARMNTNSPVLLILHEGFDPQDFQNIECSILKLNAEFEWFHLLGWKEVNTYTFQESIQWLTQWIYTNNFKKVIHVGFCRGFYNAFHIGLQTPHTMIIGLAPISSLERDDAFPQGFFGGLTSGFSDDMRTVAFSRNPELIGKTALKTIAVKNEEAHYKIIYSSQNPLHTHYLRQLPVELLAKTEQIVHNSRFHAELVEIYREYVKQVVQEHITN